MNKIEQEALVEYLIKNMLLFDVKFYSSTTTWHAAFEDKEHKWNAPGLFISENDLHKDKPTVFIYQMNCGKIVYLLLQHPNIVRFGSDLKKASEQLGVKVISYGSHNEKLGYKIHFTEWAIAGTCMSELVFRHGERKPHWASKPRLE